MTDPPTYDVRDEPWVPVRISGRVIDLGLRELFLRARDIEDLALPVPPAASGLLRILYAIAARVTGLDDAGLSVDEWLDRRDAVLGSSQGFDPVRVSAYFDRPDLAGRFDLFDPQRPFLQDPRLVEQCKERAGIGKLVLGRPSGDNQVFFTHFTDVAPVPIPTAQAAWYLVAASYYGPGGRCSTRTVTPPDGQPVSKADTKVGPLRGAISFHPLGRDLFESLVTGIPRYDGTEPPGVDDCPWERPEQSDPIGALPPITWPGGLLTGRARHAMLLVPSPDGRMVTDAYLTWASRADVITAADPYLIVDIGGANGVRFRPASADRALWRDLDALLRKGGEGAGFRRPRIFGAVGDLDDDVRHSLRVRAYGFDQETGKVVDKAWFTATTPPIFDRLEERDQEQVERVAICREAAEKVGEKLKYAARIAWAEAESPPGTRPKLDSKNRSPWAVQAMAAYWPRAERTFWSLLTAEHAGTEPHQAFVRDAQSALAEAVGNAERQLKAARAVSHARAIVNSALPKPALPLEVR